MPEPFFNSNFYHNEIYRTKVKELQAYFCPFGNLQAAHMTGGGFYFEIIDDNRQSYGADNFETMDPVYCVLDHILQMAEMKYRRSPAMIS